VLGRLARRRAAGDEGAIAIMAALLIPVILGVIALALSSLIWGASETEVQRASDRAATEAAASALLLDFPYASVDTVSTLYKALYPTLQTISPTIPTSADQLAPCNTLGNPLAAATAVFNSLPTIPGVPAVINPITGQVITPAIPGFNPATAINAITSGIPGLPSDVQAALASLPASCTGLTGPVTPIPNLPAAARKEACDTASENVADNSAPYAFRFFSGDFGANPNCLAPLTSPSGTNNGRVSVAFATENPLLGFGGTGVTVGDNLALSVPSGIDMVQKALAPLGVHLNTVLPNALCPQVSVGIDQPVRGLIAGTSVPNGRSTARRVLKNVVVVPVYNGQTLASAQAQATLTANGLGSVYTTVNGTVTTPSLNLNSTLLSPLQVQLNNALAAVDARINSTLTAANAGVQVLNGVYDSVSATATATVGNTTIGATKPAVAGNVGQLDLLKCVRQSVSELYNPPTGKAASVDDVLAQAAKSGEPVTVIQVGVTNCATPVPTSALAALSCVQAATGSGAAGILSNVTGLYDVPFLDVTPTVIRDVGNGNYQAIPVHGTQANGAFRATLIRSTTDSRFVK
jgi:Flp pilus assembly protein TadG